MEEEPMTKPCKVCGGKKKVPWTHPSVAVVVLDVFDLEVKDEYDCPSCQNTQEPKE